MATIMLEIEALLWGGGGGARVCQEKEIPIALCLMLKGNFRMAYSRTRASLTVQYLNQQSLANFSSAMLLYPLYLKDHQTSIDKQPGF